MSVIHLKERDVVKSSVKGVVIEFDHDKLATILGVHRNNGICEFGKRDTSSFMDLTYMDHLMSRRLVNLPRVMIRHMSYVISMKYHELPYGDWLTMVFEEFGVPLVNKKGEEPKRYDYFEETFLTMCKLKREDEIWWIGSGENKRRDDDDVPEEEEVQEEEGNQADFDWEAVVDEAAVEGESGSGEKFYDAEDEAQGSPEVNDEIPAAVTHASTRRRKKNLQESTPRVPLGEFQKL
ncbi:hypothetical protein Dimus_020351 [Dionaea muscipula]